MVTMQLSATLFFTYAKSRFSHVVLFIRMASSRFLMFIFQSVSIPAGSEEEVFKILKLPYREPAYRNC